MRKLFGIMYYTMNRKDRKVKAMTSRLPFDEYERLWKEMSRFQNILRPTNIENMRRLTDSIARAMQPSAAVADIVARQAELLSSLRFPSYNEFLVTQALESQWNSLAHIVDAYKTPEIEALQNSLMRNDFGGLQAFADSLNCPQIEAANLAIIKMAPIFEGVVFPKGIVSAISGIHVDTAKKLLDSENVSFDTSDRCFYVEESPDDRATISETNILCSSLDLLAAIDEADLISFLTHLEKFPAFASEHTTGRRIREIVAEWSRYLDFDHEYFYHARALEEGACPFTEAELGQAPRGYTGHGRYNYVGQSHYYFSNEEKGAIMEVKRHTKNSRVQIAKLSPRRSIRMIDLSAEITTQNKFLEYCRFNPPTEQYPNIKREYLLPCYVAGCCRMCGIEGIKYYGSKEYSNYVAWDDGYFNIISSHIV